MNVFDVLEGVAIIRKAVQFGKLERKMLPTCSLMAEANDFQIKNFTLLVEIFQLDSKDEGRI